MERINWKDLTDDDIKKSIIRVWVIFKNGYEDPWIFEMCKHFTRQVTNHIGLKKQQITLAASSASGIVHKHHMIPSKEFFDEWKTHVNNKTEFTLENAEEWLKQAQNLVCTPKEHAMIHNKKY